MSMEKLIYGNKQAVFKTLKILGYLLVLSLIVEVCTLFMTVVPFDFALVTVLLTDIRIILLNFFPVFTSMSVIYLLSNSISWSFTVTSVIAFVISQINIYTMTYRDSPFVFSDIMLISEAGEMLKTYSLFFGAVSVIVLIVLTVSAILCFKLIPKLKANKYVRISCAVLAVVLVILLGNRFYRDGYGGYGVYLSTWHAEFGNEYKSANQCMSRGVIYSFSRSIYDSGNTPPEGYDEKAVKSILGDYENVPLGENKKVHIISIMLEAYNDFSRFPGIELNVSPYKNFHELQKDSYSGKLYTNVFAGNTIQTERAFLTGFGGTDFQKKTMSHVRYFKSQGYYTEAMHPFYGWFYDRKSTNKKLGFDNFECYENKFSGISDAELSSYRYNGMISDLDFFDYIIAGYRKAVEQGQKYFNFSVTYQNHGPYASEMTTDTEFLVKKDIYPEAEYHNLNNYLSEINRTDMAIKKLRDFVDSENEPIVLILFGDHNPLIGNGSAGYEALGIDVDTSTPEGAENYYCTPYVFYANDAAKECLDRDFVGVGNTVSPIFLMNELFEYIGVKGSFYMNYLQTLKDQFNVLNLEYVRQNGEYAPRSSVSDNEQIRERQWVEYYLKDNGLTKDGFSLVG